MAFACGALIACFGLAKMSTKKRENSQQITKIFLLHGNIADIIRSRLQQRYANHRLAQDLKLMRS
jgi:hypothetical protein